MAKKKTPFAESKDGKLFVKANSFMTPLVALVDGLTIAYFDKCKDIYLPIDVAIDWVQKEMQHHSQDKYSKVLGVLKSAKEQHEAGVMEYSS